METRVQANSKRVYRTIGEMTEPTHTALLVIDMQRSYCGEAQIGRGFDPTPQRRAAAVIGELVALARAAGVLPIFVQNVIAPNGATHSGVAIANELHVWNAYGISEDSNEGSEFVPEVGYRPSDVLVKKHRNSAFHGTSLDLILRSSGIDTVVLTGQATFACVDTTARDALTHDYYVTVVEDAVATVREELPFHEASLNLLRHHLPVQGTTTSAELRGLWSDASAQTDREPAGTTGSAR